MSQQYECPHCKAEQLQRVAAGIWECKKCGTRRSGGAYTPRTDAETVLKRALSDTTETLEELEAAQEAIEE